MVVGSILKGEFLSLESARKIKTIDSLSKELNMSYDRLEKNIKIILKKYNELQTENERLKKENKELQLLVLEGIKKRS